MSATKQLDYYFDVPGCRLGRLLAESRIKSGLVDLNRDVFFDLAGRHNIRYPFPDYVQGVYYDGWPDGRKYVCPMDRGGPLQGMIAEVPVWSTVFDMVEVPWSQVTPSELLNPQFGDLMPAMRPPCGCSPRPGEPCEHDRVLVKRLVKGDMILGGWRALFITLCHARLPGIDRSSLEAKFGVTFNETAQEVELFAGGIPPWMEDNDPSLPDEGDVLNELGAFEKIPTSGPWEGARGKGQ